MVNVIPHANSIISNNSSSALNVGKIDISSFIPAHREPFPYSVNKNLKILTKI